MTLLIYLEGNKELVRSTQLIKKEDTELQLFHEKKDGSKVPSGKVMFKGGDFQDHYLDIEQLDCIQKVPISEETEFYWKTIREPSFTEINNNFGGSLGKFKSSSEWEKILANSRDLVADITGNQDPKYMKDFEIDYQA